MTLSQRIAALTRPDRAIDAEIAKATGMPTTIKIGHELLGVQTVPFRCLEYTSSIDAAISIVQPAMQEHVMREALTLAGQRGFIVGKFTEQLARTICEVAMRERGL